MPYVVLETLEESDVDIPAPLTPEQRIARSVDGWDPAAAGHSDLFDVKAPAKRWTP